MSESTEKAERRALRRAAGEDVTRVVSDHDRAVKTLTAVVQHLQQQVSVLERQVWHLEQQNAGRRITELQALVVQLQAATWWRRTWWRLVAGLPDVRR